MDSIQILQHGSTRAASRIQKFAEHLAERKGGTANGMDKMDSHDGDGHPG